MTQHLRKYSTSSDLVYLGLREKIISHVLKPAQRLLEVKIANEMGVSRTPVREALRRLASEGLVKIVPNSGASVASPTVSEMENAYSVREYLENFSVELACRNGLDRRAIERIENALHSEEDAYAQKDIDAFLAAGNNFHHLIAESGKNTVLCEYIDNIMLRTNVYIFFYDNFGERENYSTREHREILRAVAQRDRDRAQEQMKAHLKHMHNMLDVPENKKIPC